MADRTRFRPTSLRSSSMANAKPMTIEPTTVTNVNTTVLVTICQVSLRPNHSR